MHGTLNLLVLGRINIRTYAYSLDSGSFGGGASRVSTDPGLYHGSVLRPYRYPPNHQGGGRGGGGGRSKAIAKNLARLCETRVGIL
jgi:hypothetical protein